MFIEWNDAKHSIGIDIIDNQHKELFIITNQLHDVLDSDVEDLELYQKDAIKILKRLYAYTSYHFISEEALLKEYKYDDIENHKVKHNNFRNKIKVNLENLKDRQGFSLIELQDYLVEWILKHIQGTDVKYATFFKEKALIPDMHFSTSNSKKTDVLDQWVKQKLELEIKNIDNQHKELISILQQVNDLQHTSESRRNVFFPVIIEKLLYYSQYHFSFEEEHMSKNAYPLLKEQQQLHKEFVNRVIKFTNEYKHGMFDLGDEMILFLKDWVVNHILQEDKKYKIFLEQKKSDLG